MKRLILIIWLLPLAAAHAAGFDCGKASTAMELAVCGEQSLSDADGQLNDAYAYLLAQCPKVAAHAGLRATQRRWLTDTGKDFGAGSPEALDSLRAAYRTRNDALAKLVAECNPHHGPARASVRTVEPPGGGESMPFVESNPPHAGWRINKIIFHSYGTAPPPEFSKLGAFLKAHKPAADNGTYETFSVASNNGNLLVLVDSGTDCPMDQPRCSPFYIQYMFDIRTGRITHAQELFTRRGARTLTHTIMEKLLGTAKARLSALPKADREQFGYHYDECTAQWKTVEIGMYPDFNRDGSMRFGFPDCSERSTDGQVPDEPEATALDGISVTMPLAKLRPYLSAYGRSLLLGEGDVRTP